MPRILSALSVILLLGLLGPILVNVFHPGLALAHERRKVGKYELEVGFLEEPALVGQLNPVLLEVVNTETKKPVEGLQQTLDAEITYGGKTKRLSLSPSKDEPGRYLADIIPTRVGAYALRFYGQIEGLKIDEKFLSGPGTFSDVEGVADLQFPDKVPDAAELAATAQDARNMAVLLGGAGIIFGAAGIVLALSSFRVHRT